MAWDGHNSRGSSAMDEFFDDFLKPEATNPKTKTTIPYVVLWSFLSTDSWPELQPCTVWGENHGHLANFSQTKLDTSAKTRENKQPRAKA